jgi:ribosomal protein S18 acetylase RimI-like enzyme
MSYMTTTFTLRPASSASFEERAGCMNAAYADYHVPLHVTADQLANMDVIYDVDSDASVVAGSRGRLVGMALLSRRAHRGWISAVGTVPAARRQGVARQMMRALIANARRLGLAGVALEVISENARAHTLYLDLGFKDVRELLTWRLAADADPLPIPQELLSEATPASVLVHFDEWHKEPPSWQREMATLRRLLGRARAYRLDLDGQEAAYAVISERMDGIGLLDVGINPAFGAVRAGRPLLQALSRLYPNRALSILNVPADDSLCRALAALRFNVTLRQWEMIIIP